MPGQERSFRDSGYREMKRKFYVIFSELNSLDNFGYISKIISSSFFLSHDIRREVELVIIIEEEKLAIKFVGTKIRHIHVDESSLSGIIKKIKNHIIKGRRKGSPHTGITIQSYNKIESIIPSKSYIEDRKGIYIEKIRENVLKEKEFSIILLENKKKFPNIMHKFKPVRVTLLEKTISTKITILNIILDRWLEGKQGIPT